MKNNEMTLTDKNLDALADFLTLQMADATLAEQIPDKAHLFHGVYHDAALTQANIKLATKTLLGMALGYVETAPLVMIFEHHPGERTVINLSEDLPLKEAQIFIEAFQSKSQQAITSRINTA